ncbi:MAG: hypothetical protein OXU53_08920 [Deltaproteobacteria bacterium]|nr:hypothetical protein [Deltaproteobacteria bacterium]MDD9872177.1 hypothetical protein [Deltaproteobacteria bacterium]
MNGPGAFFRRLWSGLLQPMLMFLLFGAILCGGLFGLLSATVGVVYLATAFPIFTSLHEADPALIAGVLIAAAILAAAVLLCFVLYIAARRRRSN